MDNGQDAFFAVIGEGAELLKNLDENSPGFFDSLNRLREILAILGYESAVKPLYFSLEDKAGSAKALSDYLTSGINVLPDELAVFEAHNVRALARIIGNGGLDSAAAEWAAFNGKPMGEAAFISAFQNIAARGISGSLDREKIMGALAKAEELGKNRMEDDPAYIEARAAYDKVSADRFDKIKEISARRASGEITAEQAWAEENVIYDTYDKAQTEAWEKVKAVQNQFRIDKVAACDAVYEEHGRAILNKIMAASLVTEAQAQEWASRQIIDDNAKAKLRRLGYKPEDVVRDMAEYYRLTGGKASTIRISLDGGRRANAVGVTTLTGEKVINLGSSFDKTVLFHELAHHLENDMVGRCASTGFLLKRRESDKRYRLRDLTGNRGYRSDEIAYKDSWMHPYIGKIYSDGVTEVFSMGVQYLATPKDALNFAARDPEMLDFISGYLGMELTPAMRARLDMHGEAVDLQNGKSKGQDELYQKALAILASKAPITKDDWFAALDRTTRFYDMLTAYVLPKDRKGSPQYIGSNGQYKVFAGTYRNPETKRNAKGFLIVDANTGGDNGGGWGSVPDSRTLHGDLETVSAFIALVHVNGVSMDRVFYDYFLNGHTGAKKQKVIDIVGVENLK
jgi:hypothetical protein